MFRSIRRRPRAAIIGIAACAVLAGVGVAVAHYIAVTKYVWEDGNGHCLKSRSEISDGHTDGGHVYGYSKVNGFAQKPYVPPYANSVDCAVGWVRDLRVKAELQKKQADGSFKYCNATGWKQVSQLTEVEITRYWNADCGAGYYRTRGYAQLLLNGVWVPNSGTWWNDTGTHYLH
jgi:hypothetical protein